MDIHGVFSFDHKHIKKLYRIFSKTQW